ncbi:lytic transglycosylase [Mangrovibrevibacter kandeliae]|uniref:lytic transglycosylase n=1 Tax=Mangrovibrevibacter kandeliae TaxID=2968473 RepID=UPI002117753A|nr:LysM peptidoglycan-binding domain-containing protein [Aurantimonas sp. CSK15Z-1]MCQ8783680.1 LysM peptidoglycan-binding domain-containing protein [Aurantimonas sp. CSK15Z-1]
MPRRLLLLTPFLLLAPAASAQESGPCGPQTTVESGDTLSSLAQRCAVTEGLILRANPGVDGSQDLRVGQTVSLVGPLDQLKSMASDAGGELAGAARDVGASVGSSVQDFLHRNPKLDQNIRSLGRSVGVGDGTTQASVTIAPDTGPAGSTVTVSATGLPADTDVVIDGGVAGTASEVLDKARTTPEGTLQSAVKIPEGTAGKSFRIGVRDAGSAWIERAPAFTVEAGGSGG